MSSITPLESAVILVALIVVASVFVFTIVSAGAFSSADGYQVPYTGTQAAQAFQIRGDVLATSSNLGRDSVDTLILKIGLGPGSEPIDLTDTGDISDGDLGDATVLISYRDKGSHSSALEWDVDWITNEQEPQNSAGDNLLEAGEVAEITIWLASTEQATIPASLQAHLATNTRFTIELVPPAGVPASIERVTPDYLTTVMNLH